VKKVTLETSYIKTAITLADLARPIAQKYFRTKTDFLNKLDNSPVTIADREIETAMRSQIQREFPDHGILGEEFESYNLDSDYVWVLDPIDGTKSFITGKPLFGVLIALCYKTRPILGIIDQPILKERWFGAKGLNSTHNNRAIATRSCTSMADAWLYATSPSMFENKNKRAFDKLSERVKFSLYGADCYAYGLLASGYTDIVCEASLKPYDYCALVPIIEGAGGKISDWSGKPLSMTSDGTILAAGNTDLHTEALKLLNE